MTFERWDPFRDVLTFRDSLDRLLQQGGWRTPGPGDWANRSMPINVREQDDAFLVTASLAGVRAEDIHVTAEGEKLSIRAESHSESEPSKDRWVMRERSFGVLERTVTLPSAVDSDAAQAKYENGVLSLRLPKAASAQAKRIPIGPADPSIPAA